MIFLEFDSTQFVSEQGVQKGCQGKGQPRKRMLLGNRSVTCFKIRSKELSNNKKEEGTTSVKGKFRAVVNCVKLILISIKHFYHRCT